MMTRKIYLDTSIWIRIRSSKDPRALLQKLHALGELAISEAHLLDFADLGNLETRAKMGALLQEFGAKVLLPNPLHVMVDEMTKYTKSLRPEVVNATSMNPPTLFDLDNFKIFDATQAAEKKRQQQFCLLIRSTFKATPLTQDPNALMTLMEAQRGKTREELETLHSESRKGGMSPYLYKLTRATPSKRLATLDRGVRFTILRICAMALEGAKDLEDVLTDLVVNYEPESFPHAWSNMAVTVLQCLPNHKSDPKGNDFIDSLHATYIPDVDVFMTADGGFQSALLDSAYQAGMKRFGHFAKVFHCKTVADIETATRNGL